MNDRAEPAAHPLRSDPDDPPPRREQLPLPRRAGQTHLDPRLRTPGDPDAGTPFEAFEPQVPGQRTEALPPAAAFRDGARQGRSNWKRRAPQNSDEDAPPPDPA